MLLQVSFHASGRNVTIRVPSHKILIKFLFSGHHDIRQNFGGISTFSESAWLADYDCLVERIGAGCALKHPDYMIVNSGAHDAYPQNAPGPLNEFAGMMQKLASWLADVQSRLRTKVIWRGNNGLEALYAYDRIAKHFISKEGLAFLDVGLVYQGFLADLETQCCSDAHANGLHVGVIARYSTNGNRPGSRITVSSTVTQGLLNLMFNHVHNAGCLKPRRQKMNTAKATSLA